jgi:hypothetical protein
MTALTSRRANKTKSFKHLDLVGTAQSVYEGGVACFDTETGLVCKGAVSDTLIPIGLFTKSETVASGGLVTIELFEEIHAIWLANLSGDAVDKAGVICFLSDDQTACKTDAGGTKSPVGFVWRIDPVRGVLVQPLAPNVAPQLAA